jgi:hypothetical protein
MYTLTSDRFRLKDYNIGVRPLCQERSGRTRKARQSVFRRLHPVSFLISMMIRIGHSAIRIVVGADTAEMVSFEHFPCEHVAVCTGQESQVGGSVDPPQNFIDAVDNPPKLWHSDRGVIDF